jgi:enolase
MKGNKIKTIKARQILDSNGRPTPEVDVITEGGHLGRAAASTGTSVGSNEASVLRDGDPTLFGGLSVYRAVDNIKSIIAPVLIGMDVTDQQRIDQAMIDLDGTRYKTKLGGNAIYATSIAVACAAAAAKNEPFYRAMASDEIKYIYTPAANVVNGGVYLNKTLAFQEFMIIPHDVSTISDGIRIIVEVFQHLGRIIERITGCCAFMGHYSGYGAPSDDPYEVFEIISTAVTELGYKNNVYYAIDCASSHFYDKKQDAYLYRGSFVDRNEIIKLLAELANKYPILFIEDPLQEEDFDGFKLASERINSVIVGDDFLCTNIDRAKRAVEMGAVKGMIFKPNQAGTLTEALETAYYMIDQGLLVVPSGRAGGALGSPEKELGLAIGCYLTKAGAPRSGSRIEGFNFMLRTAEELNVPMTNVSELSYFSHLRPQR